LNKFGAIFLHFPFKYLNNLILLVNHMWKADWSFTTLLGWNFAKKENFLRETRNLSHFMVIGNQLIGWRFVCCENISIYIVSWSSTFQKIFPI
jgi:hypothetical protein